jgi:predicted DNA-binding ribbon-helix-helix protein
LHGEVNGKSEVQGYTDVHEHIEEFKMARTRRAQILMEPQEYDRLEVLAQRRGCSVAELIRQAVQEKYLVAATDRMRVVEGILSLDIPVSDWDVLKKEIEESHNASLP